MELNDSIIIDVRDILYFNHIYFFFLDNDNPGPSTYKANPLIGTSIFNSKYQSPSFFSMSQKLTLPNRNDRYPGPGSYIRFSEFGVLDPNFKKRMRLQTEPSKTKEAEETKNEENGEYNEFNEYKVQEEVKPLKKEKTEDIKKQETRKDEDKYEEIKDNENKKEEKEENKKEENVKEEPNIKQSLKEENKKEEKIEEEPKIKEEDKNEEKENEDDKSDCIFLREKLEY